MAASIDSAGDTRPAGVMKTVNLAPAKWIWLPSQRTLANTFVLFRRSFTAGAKILSARGGITADSRYLLTVNGRRVQWGPAPSDPRWLDVDGVDILPYLREGENVIGVEALYYGLGDGTSPMGKPGVICNIRVEYGGGGGEDIVSDGTWLSYLDRARGRGHYKRWYLRSLQEEFDAGLHPYGWNEPGFEPGPAWMPAMVIDHPADKPIASGPYNEYQTDSCVDAGVSALVEREIPPMREIEVPARGLVDSFHVEWRRDPNDWFEYRMPGSFEIAGKDAARETAEGGWELHGAAGSRAAVATFDFDEQVVGWPYFTIDAPAGTVVEVITQESHDPSSGLWLDRHWYRWSRFICREGRNRFENFEYESLRWIQLHVRNAGGPVRISGVGVRRRIFDWPNEARIKCGDKDIQQVIDAALNTLSNSAQETCVDGMGRERQQYSGDVGHQLHAVRYAYGETGMPARFLRTYSQGLTLDGYFMDCWPAYDRLARLPQRQVQATRWGPLVDHGVGFNFDCWNHYMETGDLDAVREAYPRLLRFAGYLETIRGDDGLLKVEDIGIPAVWMDHDGFRMQRHKRCSFNLYTAAMLKHALGPLCRAFGDDRKAEEHEARGEELERLAVKTFWDASGGIFVDNLPWLDDDGGLRCHDRTLAMSILFDQCPEGDTEGAVAR
ncbi:MAG: alpha-L-rhamnosidase N-terminal domain-containing protein, partial [Planctomycetes bacterium]|nr:alpha-L-rhamnosidase N-terminal domain-containing protein [Planctomycetota bacterium]